MSMEKINSDELKEKQARIPLSDDEMEKVAGGGEIQNGIKYVNMFGDFDIVGMTYCYNPECSHYQGLVQVYSCWGSNRCCYCEQPVQGSLG